MEKALDVLKKSADKAEKKGPRSVERRLGKKPGEVKARTIIGGRSYDHVETGRSGERELHPTNITKPLGTITETAARTFIARDGNNDLGEHVDHHKAAHAIVSHARTGKGVSHSNAAYDPTDTDSIFGPFGAGNSRSTTSAFA